VIAPPYSKITVVRAKVADTVVGHYGADFTVVLATWPTQWSATTALISRLFFGTGRVGRRGFHGGFAMVHDH
jgi:hypothetical protein